MTIREVKMAFKNDWTSHFKCLQVIGQSWTEILVSVDD
jgi:hypothetical protein